MNDKITFHAAAKQPFQSDGGGSAGTTSNCNCMYSVLKLCKNIKHLCGTLLLNSHLCKLKADSHAWLKTIVAGLQMCDIFVKKLCVHACHVWVLQCRTNIVKPTMAKPITFRIWLEWSLNVGVHDTHPATCHP